MMKPNYFAQDVRKISTLHLCVLATALLFALGAGLVGCSSNSASSDASASATATSAESSTATDLAAGAINVAITVTSEDADGSVSGDETVSLEKGASVLDAMEASSFSCEVVDSQWGAYIDGINGLKSGDFGGMSGWVYTVNGETVSVSAGEYVLSDGDTIDWKYVTDMS